MRVEGACQPSTEERREGRGDEMGVLATLLPLPRNGIFAIILREGTRSKKMGGGGAWLPTTLYPLPKNGNMVSTREKGRGER
jgi:hypothetical protein